MFECLRSKRRPIDREGCGVPQNGGNELLFDLLLSKWGSCSSGGVWRTTKRDSTGYCSFTVDFLQPPPAIVHPPSTSSSLHRLLFIQPSTGSCSSSLHRLLFNQPSTGSCSTNPPRGLVQPALHGVPPPATVHPPPPPRSGSCSSSGNGLYYHEILFIQPPPGTVHPTPTGNCSSNPHRDLLIQTSPRTVHQEAASIGFS